jgi:hypothetical protein
MLHLPTVHISQYETLPALKMTWETHVSSSDVSKAFLQITDALEEASTELYVIVDWLKNPKFPLSETINGALFGPYRHPKLRGWLILGGNSTARFITRTLINVTGRDEIYWFKNEAEALRYLQMLINIRTASVEAVS